MSKQTLRKRLIREGVIREAGTAPPTPTGPRPVLNAASARLKEAGRVLSAANEEKLRTAQEAIAAVLAALEADPAEAEEAADDAKCDTCKGDGKIRAGTTKCPDCGGSGLAKDVKKEARRARLLGLAEAYSSAASDAGDGAYIVSLLLNLMSEESDEPGELSVLNGALALIQQWISMEVSTIGNPDDVADSETGGGFDMWGWEAARKRLQASGGPIRRISEDDAPATPPDPGYVPQPYTPDPDERVACPSCGLMNDTDAKFCDQCGFELTGSTAIAASRRRKEAFLREGGVRLLELTPLLAAQAR